MLTNVLYVDADDLEPSRKFEVQSSMGVLVVNLYEQKFEIVIHHFKRNVALNRRTYFEILSEIILITFSQHLFISL